MSIKIGDNFSYLGKKFLDARQSFQTLTDMKKCNDVPIGFITYCVENNKRYEYNPGNEDDATIGKWREYKVGADVTDCFYMGDETPDNEDVLWFDSGEANATELTYDNPIVDELFACIRTLQSQISKLQEDVEYLKLYGGGGGSIQPPDDDDDESEIVDIILGLEDGGLFLLEDGGFMILEESEVVSTTTSNLSLEDGGLFLLEDGGFMILENVIEEINESVLLLENSARLLLENSNEIKLENAN